MPLSDFQNVAIIISLHVVRRNRNTCVRFEFNLLQNMLPMIWPPPVEIDVEKIAAWEEDGISERLSLATSLNFKAFHTSAHKQSDHF